MSRRDDDRDSKDGRENPSRERPLSDDELLTAARYYRDEEHFEEHLIKERGFARDSAAFRQTVDRWKLQRERLDQERRGRRGGGAGPEAQREGRQSAREVLDAARRAQTREEFEKFLTEKLGVTPSDEDYDKYMTAWATFKREKEGF